MKKRILAILLCLCMAVSLLPTAAWAALEKEWNYGADNMNSSVIVKFDSEAGTLTVTGTGEMWDLPDNHTSGGGLTSGTAPWFSEGYRSQIKKIVVDYGITRIGNGAFMSMDNLESVTLPESLLSIGDYAFHDCGGKLTEITIPNSVKTIGDHAFQGWNALTLIKGGEGVMSFGTEAFNAYTKEPAGKLMVVPKSFTGHVGRDIVYGYSVNENDAVTIESFKVSNYYEEDKVVEIPGTIGGMNVTAIGQGCFARTGVTSVTLPDSVTSIGVGAFSECISLKSVELPSGLEEIPDSAFKGCSMLTDVTLPGSLTSIGADAFSGCTKIGTVVVPASVTNIGENAFKGCNSHTDSFTPIIVPESVKESLAYTYSNEDTTKYYPNMIAYSVSDTDQVVKLTWLVASTSPGRTVTLPETIGNMNVTDIGSYMCATQDANGDGSSDTHWRTTLNGVKAIVLPGSVKTIGEGAFINCYELESIQNLDKVTSLGANAFENTALTSVTLANGLETIPDSAFAGCQKLESVTIPESVTDIGAQAFLFCALKSVVIPKNVETIAPDAFSGCGQLKTLVSLGTYNGELYLYTVDGGLTVVWPGSEYPGFNATVFTYTRNADGSDNVTITGVYPMNNATTAAFPAGTGLNVTMALMQQNGDRAINVTGISAPQLTYSQYYRGDTEGAAITKIVPVNGAKVTIPETVKMPVYEQDGVVPKGLPVVYVEEAYRQYADHTGRDHVYVEHGEGICQLCGEKADHEHVYEYVKRVSFHSQVCTLCKGENPEGSQVHTYGADNKCTVCGFTKHVLSKIVYETDSARTKYLVGQAFDLTGLRLNCTYTTEDNKDPMEEVVPYFTDYNDTLFSVDPAAALTEEDTEVTVSYTEEGITKTVKIPVSVVVGTPVTGVTLDRTSAELKPGEEITLTATVAPENATIKDLKWESSNYEVAYVTNEGLVHAKGAGTASITVTTVDGGKTAAFTLTVKEDGSTGGALTRANAAKIIYDVMKPSVNLGSVTLPADCDGLDASVQTAIKAMIAKGWILGDSYGFRPNDTITRAEVAKAVCIIRNISENESLDLTEIFTDVTADFWANPFIAGLYAAGVISDSTDKFFYPNELATEADLRAWLPTSSSSGGGSSSSGGGSGSSSSNTTSSTTTNPDGSTTTTTENKATGTVTETTKSPDGSKTVVETKKDGTVTTTETDKDGNKTQTVEKTDGSSVTTVQQKDGTTASVTTDADGKVEAEVKLPQAAVAAAQESGKAVALPIPEVQATRSTGSAPAVTVKTNSSEPVKVEIPTANVTPGTVAVLVNADGTEEVIKSSVATADGVAVSLPDGATVKIVDNSKDFADVSDAHWASDAVEFASARELFAGTSETSFSPEQNMTRAMLMTVLARYDGADTAGGSTWYEKGMAWSVANGISDGSNPNNAITREQLAVMLYRYSGSPAAGGSLDGFSDADAISSYAQEAMRWAVENGIINGFGNGQLGPKANATRAQVAQMLKNFIEM